MCGICGFTGNTDNREETLTRMMNRIIHRGPDSAGKHISDGIAMGFRRLAIIDLNSGDQPMYNEDGTLVVTFNGEIYNYRELRKTLEAKGHIFSNNADTEVLLHGYEEYGPALVDMLRGMFSFVLWDTKTKTLFGARDPFGIKPFYYAPLGNDLAYGSEIKSILEHPSYQKKVNPEALENYLTFQYSVLPETFFKGIFTLPPAHYFTFKNGDLKITRYFDPTFAPDEKLDFEETVNRIDETLQESVRAHMLADVEVGSFLSSGVDSSYVAASFHGDKTFTVGFDYEKYNETEYAKDLSSKIGIANYGRIISTEEYWNALPKIQYHMDEPLADPSAVALYFVSETASKHVKVALSGEGADEFFGGYNIYHEPFSLAGYQKLPEGLRRGLAGMVKAIPFGFKGKNFLIRGSKPLEERFIGNAFMFSEEERAKILKNPTGLYSHKHLTRPFYKKTAGLDDVTRMQYIDVNFWLIGDILLKADKMSMANSLEVRVPFLDRKVFDLARTLPTSFKVNDKNTKVAFRTAAHRRLPDFVAEKKKLGFPVPIRIWLREEKYYNMIKAAFTGNAAESFFNTSEILKLLDDHRAGKADNSRKIWTVYMFLVWYKEFFE